MLALHPCLRRSSWGGGGGGLDGGPSGDNVHLPLCGPGCVVQVYSHSPDRLVRVLQRLTRRRRLIENECDCCRDGDAGVDVGVL